MNTKTDISAAYVGGTGVDKLYLGNEVVWQNTPPGPVPYEEQNLTFNITSPGTIRFGKVSPSSLAAANDAPTVTIYYKVNSGNWTAITTTTAGTEFNVVSGDTVQFKGDNAYYGYAYSTGLRASANSFSGSTATFDICGNIMSLIDSQNFATIDRTWAAANHKSAFYCMFRGTQVVDASNLVLQPSGATQDLMADFIYQEFFNRCSYLVAAPTLPATMLRTNCYTNMFQNCSGMTTAPAVSATTLAASCCTHMFDGCSSLTAAPALPATTLSNTCYSYMFQNCTSLTTAPALPATTLKTSCYAYMFLGCTGLTVAPVLPATTLANNCYQGMFNGCRSLNTITCLGDISGTAYTRSWTTNVAATGTFYKDANATGWTTGVNGIPSGWTVQDYVDPATIPVLKIAGQSITGTSTSDWYEWGGLDNLSGSSCTIEVGGVPITADTWEYYEYYMDECGQEREISHETGTTRSVFETNSGYIVSIIYDTNNNFVYYSSYDDHTSDDPEFICTCQGGCWDGETCQSCEPEDTCLDWENLGFASYEECRCQEYGEGCGDPCDDWENMGYSSWEECTCADRGENCPEEESGE